MKSYKAIGIVFVALFVCLATTVQADTINLVTNGDFDTDLSGWGVYGGSAGRFEGAETYPNSNGASAYINGDVGTWLQTKPSAPLVAGQTYEVSFFARILGTAGETNDVDKTIYAHVNSDVNGVLVPYTALLTNTWERHSFQFTPTVAEAGDGYGVAFLNNAANAGYGEDIPGVLNWAQFGIDAVSLTAVPEPSAVLLAMFGVFGLLAYAWRKRR